MKDVGFTTGERAAPSGPETHHDDRALGLRERGLWRQLVEDYGAASIDLAGASAGRCRITLTSGNMVFFVPSYRRWMWLIFDHADTTPSPGAEEATTIQFVTAPATTGQGYRSPISGPMQSQAATTHLDEPLPGLVRLARSHSLRPNPTPPRRPRAVMVVGMETVLSSQKTPAAYEEALFVTEGLLLGAAYGNRVVPYEELVWVVERATGHLMHMQSMGRFLGDLVERSYPHHMDILSALAVPASAAPRAAVTDPDAAKLAAPQPSEGGASTGDGTVIDLTEAALQSQPQTVASQSS